LLTIAGWQASNIYIGVRLRRNLARRRTGNFAAQSNELKGATKQNAALPAADASQFINSTASVTENTTELLTPVSQNRRNDS
jgi:hypothetical protein